MNKKRFSDQLIHGNGKCTILLYGQIGDYDDVRSADVTRELMAAEAQYGKIDVRINSIGGDVYAGIAIFNALKNSKADVKIYIDGLAASMGAIIALCGKHVEMSKYSRLMLHSPSGGCWGNKEAMDECAKDLELLGNTLCQMCAKRLGMSEEDVRATYFDGKDHWLTAQEALDAGFIDSIYDADPVPQDENIEQLYQTFTNRLQGQPSKLDNMTILESMKQNPRFKDCASEADALKIVAQLESEAGKVSALQEENKKLKEVNATFEAKVKAIADAEKKALLDQAETAGKIDAVSRPAYQALLDKDLEEGKKTLEGLKPQKRVTDVIARQVGGEKGPWQERQDEIREKNGK